MGIMSRDTSDALYGFGGTALIALISFVVVYYTVKPKQLELCLKAGYEWVDGDCLRGDMK